MTLVLYALALVSCHTKKSASGLDTKLLKKTALQQNDRIFKSRDLKFRHLTDIHTIVMHVHILSTSGSIKPQIRL